MGRGGLAVSPSRPGPRPCTTVDRPCTQAPGGLWDTPRLRRLGRGAALRTGSPSPMSLGRSGLPDGPNDRSSDPSATYKDAQASLLPNHDPPSVHSPSSRPFLL